MKSKHRHIWEVVNGFIKCKTCNRVRYFYRGRTTKIRGRTKGAFGGKLK